MKRPQPRVLTEHRPTRPAALHAGGLRRDDIDISRYHPSPVVKNIARPTFISRAENDTVADNGPDRYGAITVDEMLVSCTSPVGASTDTEFQSGTLNAQRIFDGPSASSGVV